MSGYLEQLDEILATLLLEATCDHADDGVARRDYIQRVCIAMIARIADTANAKPTHNRTHILDVTEQSLILAMARGLATLLPPGESLDRVDTLASDYAHSINRRID